MRSYEEIAALKDPLEDEYRDRHLAHTRLRDYWHGRYWQRAEVDTGSVASIFRDLTSRSSDVGPDIKLVYNLLKDITVKFQAFLSPLPMIRVYTDAPGTQRARAQASRKERYLYGLWAENNMAAQLSDKAWYLPLMGDCFHGIFPDLDRNICRSLIRSPEHAYPLPSFDMDGLDGVIFAWKARQSAVKRMFPDYNPDEGKGRTRPMFRRGKEVDPMVEVMEFSDKGEFQRFAGTQRMNGVDHDFGFNLFEQVKFINVPGEVWGHGAVEQAVNLVEMGNAYLSLMMQSAIENVFPAMVLIDPQKAPEEIERGGGAVIPVNAGGDVRYLTPPGGTLFANAQWAHEIERMVQTDTSMPDVNFGQFEASIVTGKAINELQGAGTGSLVEMVQGVSIGSALVAWNEKAIQIGRTMFADDTIYLYGSETPSIAEINPRHFAFKLKGSQLTGSTRNEVVFLPHLDMHSKVVMGLQLAGAGLVSKQWQREQVGIPDSEAMDEEIVQEAVQDAVLGFLLQTLQNPELASDVEGSAIKYIEGDGLNTPGVLGMSQPPLQPGPTAPGAPPTPGGPLGEMPQAPPQGMAAPQGMPAGMPPGAPGAPPGAPPAPGPQENEVALDQAIQFFQSLDGLEGRVFLVGEIVDKAATNDDVEVRISDDADRDVIMRAAPFPVDVKVIEGEPNEKFIEVTPGAPQRSGGEEPTLEEATGP